MATLEHLQNIALNEKLMVDMGMVISEYLPSVKKRNGRIPCPIHKGDGYNFAFRKQFYYCFRCGCTGDIISFVENFFSLSFKDSLRKINGDFGLNLPIDRKPKMRESREMQHKREAYLRKIEAERLEREQESFLFWCEWERLADLDIDIRNGIKSLPSYPSGTDFSKLDHFDFPSDLADLLAQQAMYQSYWKEVKEV